MTQALPPRARKVKILATLGPASNNAEMIRALMEAGADAFRVNMSHGDQADKVALIAAIRSVEKEFYRPTTILVDLQGPKLRVGEFTGGMAQLEAGKEFVFDSSDTPGDATRAHLPHPELFEAIRADARILVDDGKVRLRVTEAASDRIVTRVEVGGRISDHKGVNVPDIVVPIPALTDKDKSDLVFALDQGADWIALSFVQRPEDLDEARRLIDGRAALMAKIEKPAAIDRLDAIIALSDGVMVARGDLGVELPPDAVPPLQHRIVTAARQAGKPVVVATQMLESMIVSPTPTRAEVSDVANAMYEGADAVMLSAESAAGKYPLEAVAMMDSIGRSVEADAMFQARLHFTETPAEPTTADALSESGAQIARIIHAKAMICYTSSGSTARRIARERPTVPTLAMSKSQQIARQMSLIWGVYPVHTRDVDNFEDMVEKAKRMAIRHGLAHAQDRVIIMAGIPFGTVGSTNVLHVTRLAGDELDKHNRSEG